MFSGGSKVVMTVEVVFSETVGPIVLGDCVGLRSHGGGGGGLLLAVVASAAAKQPHLPLITTFLSPHSVEANTTTGGHCTEEERDITSFASFRRKKAGKRRERECQLFRMDGAAIKDMDGISFSSNSASHHHSRPFITKRQTQDFKLRCLRTSK